MTRQIFVKVDQCTVNFPVDDEPFENVKKIIKDLRFEDILGDDSKVKPLNHYDEAIGFYNGQIKIMWSSRSSSQGIMLYFTATGLRAWQDIGRLQNIRMDWPKFVAYLAGKSAHFTRLDVAVDVLDYPFEVEDLFENLQEQKILVLDAIRRIRKSDSQKFFGENRKITGFTVGSRSSDCFLQVYNKKIEQSRDNAPYIDLARTCKTWTRFEGKFKHDKAKAIIPDLMKNEIDNKKFSQKLIGYVVNQWSFVDQSKELISIWQDLKDKAKGAEKIPPLEPKLNNRLISLLKWFFTGGAGGVFYRISQLFGEVGRSDFLEFMFEYVSKPNTIKHYSVPNNMEKDLELIKAQNPNIKTVKAYLVQTVKEIEQEKGNELDTKKEANQARQDND